MHSKLIKRKLLSIKNIILSLKGWKLFRSIIFLATGILLILLIYLFFYKVLNYLNGVELIGQILIWKLASIVFLLSFSMIIFSSLMISMSTLFYSYDLNFLISSPIDEKLIFMDKSLETVFYSSWTLAAILIPFILALIKVLKLNFLFLFSFLFSLLPFIFLSAVLGLVLSLVLMYLFPSSRTRDIIWVIGSLSITFIYMAIRFVRPEQLVRPDSLQIVAQYIDYLQAPTARYLPSWWLTKTLIYFSNHNYLKFGIYIFFTYLICVTVYYILYRISGKIYLKGLNGARNIAKLDYKKELALEEFLIKKLKKNSHILLIFMKERKNFTRDVRYWSQIILIMGLIFVYIFSLKNIPLSTNEMKSFICFLNIGAVGFVISAISLRFIFPSISMEGNSFWILKSSPIKTESIFYGKLLFYGPPTIFLSFILVSMSNYFLNVDRFIFSISIFAIIILTFTISVIAITIGALYPDFNVENIHQVESSYGGFIFMAASIAYIIIVISILSLPIRMYFMSRLSPFYKLNMRWLYLSFIFIMIISATISIALWKLAVKKIEKQEI